MADNNAEQQKVKEITDKLEQGLKELFESEKYRDYLNTMSKFHNYSFNNTLLIAMQKPDASLVAGYKAWQKNFGRHVNKGERAIRILAPAPYKIKEERDKIDPVTGEMELDENGMPKKEQVEVTIPAFRAVSVFDVSQTEGKPIPELEAKELLSTVEGYRDFLKALEAVAPVPIGFEDIPGESKGYYNTVEKRIAIQEGMSESQTLKTAIHETAHSLLHSREVNQDVDAPAKDRNTKEVEAESIAYTVCQHFGIETSEYSFGYIAGWSSGKDMKELKSSLDTIRKTASELITGIERELAEIQKDREMEQDMSVNEQGKESLLLVQDSGLSEYSLLSVSGMDADEVVSELSSMSVEDKQNVAAYLEGRGAWITEIANQDTKEWREYHLDVRYVTDRDEIIDLKAEKEMDERAKEPIGADDVILKMTYANGERFEVERITNKTPEEVQKILGEIVKLSEINRNTIHECLKNAGADFVPIIVSDGRNAGAPQFNDIEIDFDKKNVSMMHHLSPMKQAEGIINRLEFAKTAFPDEERNLIVNYAFKLNDVEKTRELAEHIYSAEVEGNGDAARAVMDAQAEIDALPDPMIGLSEMEDYGYTWEGMLPLTLERALELFDQDLPVYLLHEDGSETLVEGREQLEFYEGICGIEKKDWENERNFREMQTELAESAPAKEAQLLYGDTDRYGIYQLKDSPELRDFRFAGTSELLRRNLLSDDFREIQPENYTLVYEGELSDIQGQAQGERLGAIFEKFNIDHPEDFRGHSLSVSDIVVLHEDGKNSTHFVDSFGFTELPGFTKALEGVKEQEAEQPEKTAAKENKSDIPVYRESASYAREQGELDLFRISHRTNVECKEAVEASIRSNFDGMHLNHDSVKPVLEEFGTERLAYVLANTVHDKEWDGRFSRENKAWAAVLVSGDSTDRNEGNIDFLVTSHPAVLDGFVDLFRQEVKELEKQEQKEAEPVIRDGDEMIDLGDETDSVMAELAAQRDETELAFQIADRFIEIHETDGGYDYSIMGADYKEIDGGLYDNPDVSIWEALADVVEDLRYETNLAVRGEVAENSELKPIDHEELMNKAEEANRIVPETEQSAVIAAYKSKTDELFHSISEMNPSDIEETVKVHLQAIIDKTGLDAEIVDAAVVGTRSRGLERKGSAIDVAVELKGNEREDILLDAFLAEPLRLDGIRVNITPIAAEPGHNLSTYLPQMEDYLDGVRESMEQEARANVRNRLFCMEQYGETEHFRCNGDYSIDEICAAFAACERPFVDMKQYGEVISLPDYAWLEQQEEKLSFSIEFNIDQNEITIQADGKIETYELDSYLAPQEIEQEKAAEITLTVAECSEFHNMGEYYEQIATVEEAVALFDKIDPSHINGVPAIGINIHHEGDEEYQDIQLDILVGKRFGLDMLDYVPEIKENPQAMEVIAELLAKYPDMEIDGRMTDELSAMVWEKRMPDLSPAERLGVEIDQFARDISPEEYEDPSESMEESIRSTIASIEGRDTEYLAEWLQKVVGESDEPEDVEKAKELLERLSEYKPLAKVEEVEEQNYNQIDNIINNGAEKKQQEEAKKLTDAPKARTSLRAKLAQKKAEIAGNEQQQARDKAKKNQRGDRVQ